MNNCDTCKYEDLSPYLYPCCKCLGNFDKTEYWEPKEDKKEPINMNYADYVYEIVKNECKDLDSIYEDYIVKLVGEYGLNSLIEYGMLESCGFLNNRRLYVLLDKKGD